MSTNMPASLANGRYQLGQLVGRGGMAEVHVALDTRLGRTVAIKIMRADLANDKIFLTRFRREAHSVAQMNNPNIVNIYDSGEETVTNDDGTTERLPYLVMEFVKGQTLRDVIKANGPLSQRDAEQVMLGVLNALEYSHHMGIIHRDIKPGNIMISEQGVVKVMDFGIARALDDSAATMTQSQGVVGTAQYLSPEQARGETVDMRSDLYSAGCVLYEMLTGRPPFTGDSAVAIAYQHVSEVATPPSALVPGLPRMWDSICAKAMAKDRQNRYATAAEFKNDILTFMNGGMPVAAAFNPLTDLANAKARKQAEQQGDGGETVPMQPVAPTQPTAAYNPATGQFEMVPPAQPNGDALRSRAAQRAEAAKQKRKKTIIISSIVAGVVLLAAIIGVIFMMSRGATTEMGTVPTITVSMTKAQAKEKVTAAGFEFQEMKDTDSGEPAGTFTKQSPKGGAQAEKGSTVKVWFSVGPKSVQVPDVSDMSQEDARAKLEDAGFKVSASTKTADSAKIQKDYVVSTDPEAGTYSTKGTLITLYISSGLTKVPDGLAGQSQDSVLNTLSQMGFLPITQQEESDTVEKGMVTRTDPGSGELVEQGSKIYVYVSTGKPKVTVPSLVGLTLSQAKTQVGDSFTLTIKGDSTDDAIIETQTPTAGTQADKGSAITVTAKAPDNGNGDDNGTDDGNDDGNGNSSGNNGSGSGNSSGGTSGD
ncbi:Stk1 family PASTA domain-containing Ser/Thr kinase [Bifidobacterium leontopitheci]|uniref:non-specific serine/threonine protein kinase n=1 Tax=Bifidobacterium leontopitheci TaxID=2650774 RepID=A0A6I1GJH1_9BIFI|nr:Stk1 family PASTA domain-containing Ser/Thr kinase [Bifidobacterium leontopitheci]KAB7789507.1 serine/threonine protein kinase [Bifidobacterium leontopitheci]